MASPEKPIKVVSIATMFPNPRMPVHAMFVKQRLDALSKQVDLTVVSPIPWFPGETKVARYANRNAVPPSDPSAPYPTYYPKYFSIPALCKPLEGFTVAWCVWRLIRKLRRQGLIGKIDVIDCHLGFPEGFAGALLSRALGRPHTVTLRGHDINDLDRYPVRIRQVIYGLRKSARYFGVAMALVDGAVALGAPKEKGFRSSNGVDPSRFFPIPRDEARKKLGLPPGRYMLNVSHLVHRKGVDILLRACDRLRKGKYPDLRFLIVGKGGEEGNAEPMLRALAAELGLGDAIVWAGAVPNAELRWYYSAADVFCLASEKEGWPNVILESLACGTPVVAAATWGVPEVLASEDHGLLVKDREPVAFAERIGQALDKRWDGAGIAAFAAANTWDKVAEGLAGHFREILAKTGRAS